MSAFRVAITTAPDRAEGLAVMARRHDLEPVLLPCIEVVAAGDDVLDAVRSAALRADWIVVTSPRAISSVWPGGGMPDVAVAAVGPATAHAVRGAGGMVTMVGEHGVAFLVDELAGRASGRSVVFPHASGADASAAESLRSAGSEVTSIPVYETRSVPPASDPVDAAVFGSPSAVVGWFRARSLDDVTTAAIGETTASALVDRGHRPAVVPPHPDFDALIDLLAAHLRKRSPV